MADGSELFGNYGDGLLLFRCLFLLCMWYLVSNLASVFTILEMNVWFLLFSTVLTSACLLSSIVRDIRAGMVLGNKAESRPDLGNPNDDADFGSSHTGVEAPVDASKKALEAQ